jgi:hypothetical protein
MTNYLTMTTEHLGDNASEKDLAEFRQICEAAKLLHPELDDDAVTDAVWGDGDYIRNARRLGVDVDAIITE